MSEKCARCFKSFTNEMIHYEIDDKEYCIECFKQSESDDWRERLKSLEKWREEIETGYDTEVERLETENAELRKEFSERMEALEQVNIDTNKELAKYRKLIKSIEFSIEHATIIDTWGKMKELKAECGIEDTK